MIILVKKGTASVLLETVEPALGGNKDFVAKTPCVDPRPLLSPPVVGGTVPALTV